jgi:L-alanine-DL-glutamate epimerase-like enolase superfamily enzyme
MHIARAELFELALPLVEQFIIPGGRIDARRSLIVVLHDDEGHTGYGESPPFELPFYSEETLAGAIDLTQRVLLPRIVGREFASPEALDAVLRDGVRGNRFARAGVETAAWDLEAHRRGVGLSQLVAATLAVEPAASVACGVALGIPDDRQPTTLQRRVYEAPGQDQGDAGMGRGRRAGRPRGNGGGRGSAQRGRQRRVCVARARAGAALARWRRAALHGAAARA